MGQEKGQPQMSLTVLKTTGELDGKINEITAMFKRQNGLVRGLTPSVAREHTQSMLYLSAVEQIEKFLPPRLPATVYYPRLIQYADDFLRSKEYRLAREYGYKRFLDAPLKRRTGGGPVDAQEQLALETRATFGLISCDFFMALESDPELRKAHTVETVVQLLCKARATMQAIAADKSQYWLVYNGTVTIFTLCTPLLAFGYPALIIEFIIFACQSMEAQVPLCQVKYVTWRARLYATVCLAYDDAKMHVEARGFAERGLKEIRRLKSVESLDPVPPPAAMKRILAAAELQMLVNVIRFSEGMSGADAMSQIREVLQLKDQEDTPGGLEALVSAVITCLDSSQRRTIRHVQASAEETYKTEMLTLLGEIIQPKLEVLIEYDKPAEPESAPADVADSEPPADAEDDDAGAKRPPVTGQDYERVVRELSYDKMTELLKLAYNYEDHGLFKTWRALCLLRLKYEQVDGKLQAQVRVLDALYSLEHPDEVEADAEVDPKVGDPVVEGEAEDEARVRRKLHSLTRVALELSALTDQNDEWDPDAASGPDLFADAALLVWNHAETLLDTVDASAPEPEEVPPPLPDPPEAPPKPHLTATVQAPAEEEPAAGPGAGEEGGDEQADVPGEDAEPEPAAAEAEPATEDGAPASASPPATNTAAQEGTRTWKRTPPTLRQLATLVLQGVHSVFMWVQLDDALLSGTVALRLAFILEKRSRKKDAVIVLEQGISTLNRARGQLLVKDISASEQWTEMFALSSVSTNSGNTAVPRRTNEELEQALACLQVDLLHARVRVVLQQGVDDARRAAATIEAKHAQQRLQRTKDQALFGTKSRKMLREENEQAVLDQQRPVLPARAVERRLIAACNRNLYEKAIVLVEIARLPRVRPEREALLAQAAAALEQAEEAESLVAKQVQEPPITAHLAVPPPPRLVMRGATEMVLMADAWRPPKPAPGAKPQEEAVGLALFCKEEGAGVAVSLNNVLFRGSGVPRPVGEKIVVTGLQPNESYVFALAAFDRHGHVIGGIGTTSVPIVAQLPLPLLQLWAQLAHTAHVVGCHDIAKAAQAKLQKALVIQGKAHRLWEQSPVSRDVLNMEAVARTPPPVLRLFVLVLMQQAEAAEISPESQEDMSSPGTASQLLRHSATLRASKKLVMAVYVAVGIDDEPLACKAAIQLYHLLVPLLRMKLWHTSLMPVLTVMRLGIRVMFEERKQSGAGACLTSQVRRVLSCLGSAVLRSVEQLEEPELLKTLQSAEFDEQLHMTMVADYTPSPEERALIESMLCLENMRDKTAAIGDNPHIKSEAAVLSALRGSPDEAQTKIDPEDSRALELTNRVVEETIAENKTEQAKEWVSSAIEVAKAKRAQLLTIEPVVGNKEPLPSLDMPAEEVEQEKKDAEEAAADAEELRDLEIQFLSPSDEQVAKWEANKVARAERAEDRKRTAQERVEAQRAAAADRVGRLLLPRVRLLRERRQQRELANKQNVWLAVLQMNVALIDLDQLMRTDLEDAEKWPEADQPKEDDPPDALGKLWWRRPEDRPRTPPPREPAEGEEPEEAPPRVLPKRAMQSTDPAFRQVPPVPGNLRGPKACAHAVVRAVVLACRARKWALMLNACLQLSNIVRDLFPSESALRIVARHMRAVGDCLVEMLAHQAALARGAPPPGASVAEVLAFRAPPNPTTLEYSCGVLHRMDQGNRTAHDKLDSTLVSSLVLLCLDCLRANARWVAMASLGHQVYAFLDEGCALEEQLIRPMLTALRAIQDAKDQKAAAEAQFATLEQEFLFDVKETKPGGRLQEGLRARAKERAQVLERMTALRELMATAKDKIRSLQFVAVETLPGTSVKTAVLLKNWQHLEMVYDRDKSLSSLELGRCRELVAEFIKKQGALSAELDHADQLASVAGAPDGEAEAQGEEPTEANEEEVAAKKEAERQARAEQEAVRQQQRQQREAKAHVQAEKLSNEYAKCVVFLREKREQQLLPFALHEHGQLLWYLGNVQGAGQAWNDALDSIFTVMNVGRHWRDELWTKDLLNAPALRGGRAPGVMERIGLKWVLAAATIAGKLAQYVYTQDLHLQLEYALFAAHLLAAPFTNGLPHPQRARDFASYVPRELIPGEDAFADVYAVDPATLMDACELCGKVLFRNGYGLEMLPMMSLYQWCAKTQVKDSVAYASATSWKARACTQQGLLSEATSMLLDLHNGVGLPDLLPFERPPQGSQGLAVKETRHFNMLEAATADSNLEVLKALGSLTLPDGLAVLYTTSVKHQLSLCRIEVLMQVCAVDPMWPHPDPALEALCGETEGLIEALRQSLADVAAAEVAVPEDSPPAPAAEEGTEPPAPTLNGFTRLSLAVLTECDLMRVRILQKRGEYTKALETLDALMALLIEHGQPGVLDSPAALKAFGQKAADLRQHMDAGLWLECRRLRTELLFLQARWGQLKQETARALQEMAECNEQLMARDVIVRQVLHDIHVGKQDLAVSTLQQIVGNAMMLHHDDTRLAGQLALLADLLRAQGSVDECDATLTQAEGIVEDKLAALGLPQSNSKHLTPVGLLVRIKVRRAEVVLQRATSKVALGDCIQLCQEVQLLLPHAPYLGLHTRARFHLFRARARRQQMVLGLANAAFNKNLAWGGTLSPGMDAAADAATAGGEEAPPPSPEEQAYIEILQDLQAALTLTVDAGGYDAQLARCVLLEAACLHGSTLVPGQETAHLKRAMYNLKLAAGVVVKRKALLAAMVDDGTAAVSNLPPFVLAELSEAAAERARAGVFGIGNDGGGGDEPSSQRGLVSFLLANLREQKLMLFEEEHTIARIGKLHKALAEGVPEYGDACKVSLEPSELTGAMDAEAGLVIAQWYCPMDVDINGGGERAHDSNLMLVLCPESLAAEAGQQAVLLSLRVHGPSIGQVVREAAMAKVGRDEAALGPEHKAASGDWVAEVFPHLGPISLTGEAAVEAREAMLKGLAFTANMAAMGLLGVEASEPQDPAPDAPATPAEGKSAEGREGGEGDGAVESSSAAAIGTEMLGLDSIHLLNEVLGEVGVSAVQGTLCNVLYSWVKDKV